MSSQIIAKFEAMIKIAHRTERMSESATLRMAQLARQLASKGEDIINLSLGEPDFDTPDYIKQSAVKALHDGFTKYSPVAGHLDLREAICTKLSRDNKLNYKPEEIIVSNGAKQSFANLCFALLEEGDEVVLFAPYWVSYFEIIGLTGAQVRVVESSVEDDYKPDIESIAKAINARTKMIVFSSPCNPTGTVFTEKELRKYAELFKQYPDILVVSDEIYEYIQFGTKHFSIASIDFMSDRTATINGFSKGFCMTGWRLGYMAGPKYIVDSCIKIQGQFTSGAASFNQKAGITALLQETDEVDKMCSIYKKRRDHLLQELKSIPEWIVNRPDGAFYVLPQVSATIGKSYKGQIIKDTEQLALFLLQEAKVAIVSGIAFGAPDCIRISYPISEERITKAISRVRKALDLLI